MKKIITIFLVLAVPLIAQDSTKARSQSKGKVHQRIFVDKNGDGYNDNAPDHDNDGIPNGLDPDYIKLKKKKKNPVLPYVDKDGDGINDNAVSNMGKNMKGFGNKRKPVQPQNAGNGAIKSQGKSGQNGSNGKGKGKGGK